MSDRFLKHLTEEPTCPRRDKSPASCLAMNSPVAAAHPSNQSACQPGILLMNDAYAIVTPRITHPEFHPFCQ